jgi:hypothetical protein
MSWAPQFTQVLLIILIANVVFAYVMGLSPVFWLIGLIVVTTNILVRRWIKQTGASS